MNIFNNKITEQTKKLIKTREELHKLISETKLGEASAEYKCIRNKVNNRLKYEESGWQKARLEACGDNSVKTLKNKKGILCWYNSGSPTKLFYKGSIRKKAQDIADSQKTFSLKKEIKYPHKHASFCFISSIKAQEIDG